MTEATPKITATAKETALAMVVLKYLADRIKPAQAALRTHAEWLMDPKERVVATSPLDGTPLGTITKSDPEKKAEVTSRTEVTDWVADHYPEKLAVDTVVVGSHAEVVAVLAKHAPHLLDQALTLPDWTLGELLLLSKQAGAPVGWGGEVDVPGIAVTTPDGSVSVPRNPKDMGESIVALIRAGLVEIDGTVHALPAANTESAA